MEPEMEYRGNIGIMEKKMETTKGTLYMGLYRDNGK